MLVLLGVAAFVASATDIVQLGNGRLPSGCPDYITRLLGVTHTRCRTRGARTGSTRWAPAYNARDLMVAADTAVKTRRTGLAASVVTGAVMDYLGEETPEREEAREGVQGEGGVDQAEVEPGPADQPADQPPRPRFTSAP